MSSATLLGLRTFPPIVQALPHSLRSSITSMRMGRSHHQEYAQKRTITGEAEASASKTGAERRRRLPSVRLRTLNPRYLSPEDFVVLSGRMTPMNMRLRADLRSCPRLQLSYSNSKGHHIGFPDDTQGFFYWHIDPGAPALAGQVRFRVTNSKDPASFQGGQDLRMPGGDPWRVSIFAIAWYQQYKVLRSVLLSDAFVTRDLLDSALCVVNSSKTVSRLPLSKSDIIWRFGQAIPVSLESTSFSAWVVDDSESALVRILCLFRPNNSKIPPYKGTALVQFEPSTLAEHANTRTVVIRIIKILEITKLNVGVRERPAPREGELVLTRKRDPNGGHWIPWSLDIDKEVRDTDKTRAFRMLFDRETRGAGE
ncbi:hypothetical protein NEOLEDRAFT_1179301 [Neolentinus lepideus HHB14362 ss-1]|uniref:Uncharacterized protein n=1 Tax=Neolentinus lepideus HHB14362 ss-1 TaxID=1314782 RepID=A0A165RUY7_9AGAM|nr:hypothetical protein NEOLEDRAFT_1179301 [Neolentinus lepideus HHB14362 ss-1]